MSFLETLDGFLPNISVTESPGALIFPTRRLWNELENEPTSLLVHGDPYSSSRTANVTGFVINMCLLGGINLAPTKGEMYATIRTEMRWNIEGLAWKPEDFEGLQFIRVPRTEIRTPFIHSAASKRTPRTDVVLESHRNGSLNFLEVRSVVDSFEGKWSCSETQDPYPFDGFECRVTFAISPPWGPNIEFSVNSTCDKGPRRRSGDFELAEAPNFNQTTWGVNCVLKFVRNTDRSVTTVLRPTACLTILNAVSYRVPRWRVSYCCLLLISSIIISISLHKEVHANTHRIPHRVLLIFGATLSIFVGLVLAIWSESTFKAGQKAGKLESYSKWIVLIPSVIILPWCMIQ